MSLNRENIVWPSKDGTWNRGFYAFEEETWKDNFDYEWDVEYDYSRFFWVTTGHPTPQSAMEAWDGSNPGSHDQVPKYRGNAKRCQALDKMAKACKNAGVHYF